MKKQRRWIALGIALMMLVGGVVGVMMTKDDKVVAETPKVSDKTITVVGDSTILVKPSIATVNYGIQTKAKDALAAQQDNAKKMDALMKAIKAVGIEDKDIQTSNYTINPYYDYSNNSAVLAGYEVSNTLQVTVRNLDNVSKVLDEGAKAGVNQANSIQFSITPEENEKYYLQALGQAMTSAKKKADELAKAIGTTAGQPLQVTEGRQQAPPIAYYSQMENAKAMMAAGDQAATPVAAGQLEIRAEVTAAYGF